MLPSTNQEIKVLLEQHLKYFKLLFPMSFSPLHLIRLVCLCLLLSGCASTGCCLSVTQEDGTHIRYLVIGVGVITLPKIPTEHILVSKVQGLGLLASNQPGLKLSLGLASSSTVIIPSKAQALVEAKACTAGEGVSVVSNTCPQAPTSTSKQE